MTQIDLHPLTVAFSKGNQEIHLLWGGCFSSAKTIVLERVYNQQFQGTMTLIVFDF